MKNQSRFLPLSLLSLVFVGGGCFNSVAKTAVERQIESDTGGSADVNVQGDSIAYTDKETGGKVSVGTDISLPANFPSDFPVYDGDLSIISAANVPGEGVSLMFTSQDSLSEIASWYEGTLTKDGWTKDQGYNLQGRLIQSYSKADTTMGISLAEDAEVTTGTVVRSKK